VHLVTDELDSGRVLAQSRVRIEPRDDSETLAARVLLAEHELYPRVLDEFCWSLLTERDGRAGVIDVGT
jgi:phosphoribosylglycinamide formyltransferase-1